MWLLAFRVARPSSQSLWSCSCVQGSEVYWPESMQLPLYSGQRGLVLDTGTGRGTSACPTPPGPDPGPQGNSSPSFGFRLPIYHWFLQRKCLSISLMLCRCPTSIVWGSIGFLIGACNMHPLSSNSQPWLNWAAPFYILLPLGVYPARMRGCGFLGPKWVVNPCWVSAGLVHPITYTDQWYYCLMWIQGTNSK